MSVITFIVFVAGFAYLRRKQVRQKRAQKQNYQIDLTPTYPIQERYNPSVYRDDKIENGLFQSQPAKMTTATSQPIKPLSHRITSPRLSNHGLELIIKYPSHGIYQKRHITAYGLGRYKNCYYIMAHCHERNAPRTFKLARFRKGIDVNTGEIITSLKSYILAFNPVIKDLTHEFMVISHDDLD